MKLKKMFVVVLSLFMVWPNTIAAALPQSKVSSDRYVGNVLLEGDKTFDSDSIKNNDAKQWYWMSFPESRFVLHPSTFENPYKSNLNLRAGIFVHGIKDVNDLNKLEWKKEDSSINQMSSSETVWYPHKLTAQAEFNEGKTQLTEFFIDKNTFVRKFDVSDMNGSVSLSSKKLDGFQKLTYHDDLVINETDRYYIVYKTVILNDDGTVNKVVKPEGSTDAWHADIDLDGKAQFAISMTLGVKDVEGETIEAITERARNATDNNNYHTLLADTKSFWDSKLARVPAPTVWGIQGGLDAKGVTQEQHRRAFYAAWAFNYQNIMEETPETGYNYKQITLGKASMWGAGAPESPNNCSWESMFNIQQMSMMEPEIAWSAVEGFIDGIDENGILRGECLPSQKAHTVWTCYVNQPDKARLEKLYPKLKNYLKWRAENPRWIYGGHNYEDEKDISFVTQWYDDVDYVIEICKEIGQYNEIPMWEQLKDQMYVNMKKWFFTPAEGDPAGKVYNSYFTSDGSHYKYDRMSDVDNYIAEALYIDLPQDMQEQLVNYYLNLHDSSKDLVGFDFYKYGDGCYIAYGLLEKALKDKRLEGKGEEFINAVLRNVIKTVEFSEESKPDQYNPSGVKPSSFAASAVIDYTYLNNGVRINSGKLSAFAIGNSEIDESSLTDLETSVLKGQLPTLPKQITVLGKDGHTLDVFVNWEEYDQKICEQTGKFIVEGKIAGTSTKMKMNVYVYDGQVKYDPVEKTVATNQVPQLPKQVLVKYDYNGKTYNAFSDVKWDEMKEGQFIPGRSIEINGYLGFNNQKIKAKISVIGNLEIQLPENLTSLDRYQSAQLALKDSLGNKINGVEWTIENEGLMPIATVNKEGRFLGVKEGKVTVTAKVPELSLETKRTIVIRDVNATSLAYGSDATVTSQADDARSAKQAIDGNELTMWRAKDNDGQSISIDLKRICELEGISSLWFEEARPKKFKVLVSTDNNEWKEIAIKTTQGNGKQSVRDIIVFDEIIEAQYVKVEVIEKGGFQVGIQELEIYGSVKNAQPMENMSIVSETKAFEINKKAVQLQLSISSSSSNADSRVEWKVVGVNGKPTRIAIINENGLLTPLGDGEVEVIATARDGSGLVKKQKVVLTNQTLENVALNSSKLSSTTNSNDAKFAVDGDISTRWGSDFGAPQAQEFKIDFGKELDVSSIVLYCDSGAYPVDYTIQYWNGNAFVNLIDDVKDNNSPNLRHDFETIKTSAVRIDTAKTTSSEWGFSIWEFEVYGLTSKSKVQNLYDMYKDVNEDIYTPKTFEPFKEAVQTAKELLTESEITEEDILSVGIVLEETYNALIERADSIALELIIEKVEKVNQKLYTPFTLKGMNKALKDAKDIYDNKNVTQAQVDEAKIDLQLAYSALVTLSDTAELAIELKKVELLDKRNYTPTSVKSLEKVYNDSKAVFDNKNATQKEVDDAKALLIDAVKGLVERVNNSVLGDLMQQAQQHQEKNYTKESFQNLKVALTTAKKVFENGDATSQEIIEATNTLKTAIDQLEKVKDEVPIVDNVIKSQDGTVTVLGKFPKDVELSFSLYSHDELIALNKLIERGQPEFLKNATLEKVFNLDLLLKGAKYNFDGSVEVILRIDEDFKDKNLGIIYIDDEGRIQKIDSITDNGYLKFKVSHFSTYAIVSYKGVDIGLSKPGEIEHPKTNDSHSIIGYVGLTVISLMALCLVVKNRKREQE